MESEMCGVYLHLVSFTLMFLCGFQSKLSFECPLVVI